MDLSTRERRGSLSFAAGYRWLSWAVIPHAGFGVEVLGLEQQFVRDREEEIQRVFGTGALTGRRALGASFGPVLGAELPLPGHGFVLAQVRAGGRYLDVRGEPSVRADLQGQLGVGLKF